MTFNSNDRYFLVKSLDSIHKGTPLVLLSFHKNEDKKVLENIPKKDANMNKIWKKEKRKGMKFPTFHIQEDALYT